MGLEHAAQTIADDARYGQVLEAALREAFPHFRDNAPITPEAIRQLGKEWQDMVVNWSPNQADIEFSDGNGRTGKITYDPGESDVGIAGGWALESGLMLADDN